MRALDDLKSDQSDYHVRGFGPDALCGGGVPLNKETMHGILVLGGYGFFGKRICAALAKDPAIALYIAGRDRTRAVLRALELGLV